MIHPVILAARPSLQADPFQKLDGGPSRFQATLARLACAGCGAPSVVTCADAQFHAAEQLGEMGIEGAAVLVEPEARKTAPAVLAAALRHEATPDHVLLIVPADHQVRDPNAFRAAVKAAGAAAAEGKLVTLGVQPNRPEPGEAYVHLSAPALHGVAQRAKGYVAAADLGAAARLFVAGDHLKTSGVFMARVDTILTLFAALAPHQILPVRAAMACGDRRGPMLRLGAKAYARAEAIGFGDAILSKVPTLHVVPAEGGPDGVAGRTAPIAELAPAAESRVARREARRQRQAERAARRADRVVLRAERFARQAERADRRARRAERAAAWVTRARSGHLGVALPLAAKLALRQIGRPRALATVGPDIGALDGLRRRAA